MSDRVVNLELFRSSRDSRSQKGLIMAVTLPPVVTVRGSVYRVTDRTFTDKNSGEVKPVKRFDVKTPDAGLLRVKVDTERDLAPLPEIGATVTVDVEVTEYAVDGQHGVTFTRVVPLVTK